MTALRATLRGMGEPARKPITAAERRAAILALPLRPEPLSDEEEAIFQEIEAEVAAGEPTIPHAEVGAEVERIQGAIAAE
jgi:hypothetical protein